MCTIYKCVNNLFHFVTMFRLQYTSTIYILYISPEKANCIGVKVLPCTRVWVYQSCSWHHMNLQTAVQNRSDACISCLLQLARTLQPGYVYLPFISISAGWYVNVCVTIGQFCPTHPISRAGSTFSGPIGKALFARPPTLRTDDHFASFTKQAIWEPLAAACSTIS